MSYNNSISNTYVKNGIFYFVKRVPVDLALRFRVKRVAFSLRTKSSTEARRRASEVSRELEHKWFLLRRSQLIENIEICESEVIEASKREVSKFLENPIGIRDAIDIYIRLKGKGSSKSFSQTTERAFNYLIAAVGERNLDDYSKQDATQFRDWLVAKGLAGSSVARTFAVVRSVFNLAFSEYGIEKTNPFTGVYLDRNSGVHRRLPIPVDAIHRIQNRCREMDDDLRRLIALLSDSGLRLAEASGLHVDDLVLNQCDTPILRVRSHPWRRLKTKSSERIVPLVGAALWASESILKSSDGSPYAFPRYNVGATTNANSASAALNKWLKDYVPEGCSLHSFRHSFRDRLRSVGCPEEIADALGGWSKKSIGQGYGIGYDVDTLASWIRRIA